MMNLGKTKHMIYLSDEDRKYLHQIILTAPDNTVMRARILLASDFNNPTYRTVIELAAELGTTKTTIHNVRSDYSAYGLKGALFPKGIHSPERSPELTDEKRQQVLKLIKSAPPYGHRRWSIAVLRDECINQGIFDYVATSVILKILREEKIDLKNLSK